MGLGKYNANLRSNLVTKNADTLVNNLHSRTYNPLPNLTRQSAGQAIYNIAQEMQSKGGLHKKAIHRAYKELTGVTNINKATFANEFASAMVNHQRSLNYSKTKGLISSLTLRPELANFLPPGINNNISKNLSLNNPNSRSINNILEKNLRKTEKSYINDKKNKYIKYTIIAEALMCFPTLGIGGLFIGKKLAKDKATQNINSSYNKELYQQGQFFPSNYNNYANTELPPVYTPYQKFITQAQNYHPPTSFWGTPREHNNSQPSKPFSFFGKKLTPEDKARRKELVNKEPNNWKFFGESRNSKTNNKQEPALPNITPEQIQSYGYSDDNVRYPAHMFTYPTQTSSGYSYHIPTYDAPQPLTPVNSGNFLSPEMEELMAQYSDMGASNSQQRAITPGQLMENKRRAGLEE